MDFMRASPEEADLASASSWGISSVDFGFVVVIEIILAWVRVRRKNRRAPLCEQERVGWLGHLKVAATKARNWKIFWANLTRLSANTKLLKLSCRGSSLVERRPEKAGVASSILAPGTRFCCFLAQGLCPSISTLRLNLSRAILGRGSNKPERRHRGPPLLLWTAGHRLIKPMFSHAIRARMTPKHSPQLE